MLHSQGKEQVKTVAHEAMEQTETGSISSETTCNYRAEHQHDPAAEAEQHKLTNWPWPSLIHLDRLKTFPR